MELASNHARAVLPRGVALACLLSVLLGAQVARAHISLEQGGTHMSRYGDGELKAGPCGRDGGTRGTHVYTYKPGETITIKVVEFIPHPGYFRIAFDNDGDDGFVEPRSIKPVDPTRKCPYDQYDKCGESDFNNNDTVLMDNLNPHMANGTPTYTWEVTLPNVECDNCTLQIIQVMEDTVHGAYNPDPNDGEAFYVPDIYHQCIDLVLKKDAPSVGDAGAGGDGDVGVGDGDTSGDGDGVTQPGHEDAGTGSSAGDGGQGGSSGGDGDATSTGSKSSGGCSMTPGSESSLQRILSCAGLLLMLVWSRRRKRAEFSRAS